MRGRFGRRRRGTAGSAAPIDAVWLERVRESGELLLETLEPQSWEDVPSSFALAATGTGPGGVRWVVGVSPKSGGDALLAAVVAAAREAGDGTPRIAAFAPSWDVASRRRLGVIGGLGEPPRALRVLGEGEVTPELPMPFAGSVSQLAARLATPAARQLFEQAACSLEGLAAKHGGGLRASGAALELVIFARPVAVLQARAESVILETLIPSHSQLTLAEGEVAEALDRLEGQVRRRLGERRVREGEEGLRGRWAAPAAAAAGLRDWRRWPAAGVAQAIDLMGVAQDGLPVLGALRERLDLPELARVLDAALALEPQLPALLAGAGSPLRLGDRPRLLLAARGIDAAVRTVIDHLSLDVVALEGRGEGVFTPLAAGSAIPVHAAASASTGSAAAVESVQEEDAEARPARRRRGRGRRRGRAGAAGTARDVPERREEGPGDRGEAEVAALKENEPRFDEISLFDLGGEEGEDEAPRRRRRRRRRGPRGGGGDEDGEEGDPASGSAGAGQGTEEVDEESAASRRGGRRRGRGRRRQAEVREADEDDDDLLLLSPDAPDAPEVEVPAYEDDDEDEPESELDRIRLEREKRRRERNLSVAVEPLAEAGAEPELRELARPRGRAAILAHADRVSIAAAVVLARDVRQVEGLWVYPQEDLMTFFRSVATDLRDNNPIYVVGFAAKPSRDVLQAASLYHGRLVWFDHHDWPPEDVEAMHSAIGAAHTVVQPGAGSSLPAVLSLCTRRSRFSDKVVDLVTGRFTLHDFQRWGRLWWHRLGEVAKRPGERRSEVESLLSGRPSDLAKEAAKAEVPPLPEELSFVSSRDFRLVRFGGLGLVNLEVPEGLDLYLTTRIARERYAVALSLARYEGSEMLVLGADDVTGRRAVDVGAMVEHLAEKFSWVQLLPDTDHVARMRVAGGVELPERIDELIAEIGMGRSLLDA